MEFVEPLIYMDNPNPNLTMQIWASDMDLPSVTSLLSFTFKDYLLSMQGQHYLCLLI